MLHESMLSEKIDFIGEKSPSVREGMRADINLYTLPTILLLPARLKEPAGLGMRQAKVTPVEIKTSVTRLPHGEQAKRSHRRGTSAVGARGSSLVVEAGSPLR